MGATFLYKCDKCRYEADIAGGKDGGMFTNTHTIVCHSCKELMDVATGPTQLAIESQGEKDQKYPLECESCSGSNVSAVKDPIACPKCGGIMIQGDMMKLWD